MPNSSEPQENESQTPPDLPKPDPEAFSRVHLAFDLKPRARIRVTVESTAGQGGQPLNQTFTSEEGGGSVTLIIPGQPAGALPLSQAGDFQPAALAGAAQPAPGETEPPAPQGEKLGSDHLSERLQETPLPDAIKPAGSSRWNIMPGLKAWAERWKLTTPASLLGLIMAFYLAIRLIGLTSFPIYFFCDEAINPVLASSLLQNNLRDDYGELLPTFFKNGGQYSISAGVYLQVLPTLLFGRSVFVDRLVILLVSALGALWLAFILRDIFWLRYWWLGLLLISAAPIWFLNSRTGFEHCLMASFYAGFAYYYLLYRTSSPRYLYLALLMGALMFYSYTPGQLVIVVTGAVLALVDWRYHSEQMFRWKNRGTGLRALGLLALLALPLIRFIIAHPTEYADRLKMYGSYLAQNLSLGEKLGQYFGHYLAGLNPFYWFFPNNQDLPRYVMKGYAHLGWPFFPFALLGLFIALRRIRTPEYRLILVMLLAAPAGAAIANQLVVNRLLSMVIPLVLLIALGLFAALEWLVKQQRLSFRTGALILAGALVVSNLAMVRDALVNGPTWVTDYGLSGMQYGAIQVFPAAEEYARRFPGTTVYISPNWTFQGDILLRFFLPNSTQVKIGSADRYMETIKEDITSTAFIFTRDDLNAIKNSGKFKDPQPDRVINYPDGSPGFYFVRLHYQENIEAIMAAEREKRRQLVEDTVNLDGQIVNIRHSALDVGPIRNLFDGNPDTLVKSTAANPLVIEIDFPQPHRLSGLTARVGSETVRLTGILTLEGEAQPLTFTQDAGEIKGFKDVSLDFSGVKTVTRLRLELLDVLVPDPSNVHMWEVTFKD